MNINMLTYIGILHDKHHSVTGSQEIPLRLLLLVCGLMSNSVSFLTVQKPTADPFQPGFSPLLF